MGVCGSSQYNSQNKKNKKRDNGVAGPDYDGPGYYGHHDPVDVGCFGDFGGDGSVGSVGSCGGCFDANAKVLMADGTLKKAKEVKINDSIKSYSLDSNLNLVESSSKILMVISMEREENSDKFFMVNYKNKLWITSKHSIFDTENKEWIVPKQHYRKTNQNNINHTIDFVIESPKNYIINVNGIYVITMAHNIFNRFPDLYHPIKATNKCIDLWKNVLARNTYPYCKVMQLDNNKIIERI